MNHSFYDSDIESVNHDQFNGAPGLFIEGGCSQYELSLEDIKAMAEAVGLIVVEAS